MKKTFLLLALFFLINNYCFAQKDLYLDSVNKLINYQSKLKDIHPALENLYPIAIYKDSVFHVYDYDSSTTSYERVKEIKSSRYIIEGIRAAFPLEENDYKMTCIVTEEAFETDRDISVIFHEFVHCYQAATCEFDIKSQLKIYIDAMEQSDYMWEINYAFPYDNEEIKNIYNSFIEQIEKENLTEAEKLHDSLKEKLSEKEYQYLCWQEWKEGSARWIENLIRQELNVNENIAGSKSDFNRVTFYYSGSNYIELLSKKYKTNNLKDLFPLIYNR